jgi:hypothetical protein
MTKYILECTRGSDLNFQNNFDRACDEIRLEILTANVLEV